jgi:hypothetical protein
MAGSGRAQASPAPAPRIEHTFARLWRVEVEPRLVPVAVGLLVVGLAGPILRAVWPF